MYLFDAAGRLAEALIDNFGPRATMDNDARRLVHQRRLHDLGEVTFERIEVAPFALERFDITFGLIVREPDYDDGYAVEHNQATA